VAATSAETGGKTALSFGTRRMKPHRGSGSRRFLARVSGCPGPGGRAGIRWPAQIPGRRRTEQPAASVASRASKPPRTSRTRQSDSGQSPTHRTISLSYNPRQKTTLRHKCLCAPLCGVVGGFPLGKCEIISCAIVPASVHCAAP